MLLEIAVDDNLNTSLAVGVACFQTELSACCRLCTTEVFPLHDNVLLHEKSHNHTILTNEKSHNHTILTTSPERTGTVRTGTVVCVCKNGELQTLLSFRELNPGTRV